MTFFANLSLNDAFHFLLQWRAAGYRARIVPMDNGRWMVAKLESWTYKAL